jgi:branched-chain amino acid transport system ATP-binding protein
MLKLQNVHRSVGNTEIIKGVDLDLVGWQAIGLVWPNGCGKTSLLNLINGFNKSNIWEVIFNYHDISRSSVEHIWQMWIGRVFQSFGIFKNLTLFENLALAYSKELSWKYKLLPISFIPKQFKNEIDEILLELDLFDKKYKLAGNLSGWQMRLLEIARLYLQKTKLYLLDEPTAWVSPKLKSKVVDLIKKIIAKDKMVIIVEHDFEFLSHFVDKLFVMDDGKIVLEGKYNEIKEHPLTREIYFGWSKYSKESNLIKRSELIYNK